MGKQVKSKDGDTNYTNLNVINIVFINKVSLPCTNCMLLARSY